ncbi:MAG: hypothetical protein MGG11_10685 [Trichodesmium sp. MAG_R03]|nr:hypothetical protein [Trichodesmium sp. MAG_R03]
MKKHGKNYPLFSELVKEETFLEMVRLSKNIRKLLDRIVQKIKSRSPQLPLILKHGYLKFILF